MAEEENAAPEGASEQPSIESIEDKLGSFDFDAAPAPAGEKAAPEPREEQAEAAPAGEVPAEQAKPEDDDPEINLRDNRKVRLSELKRGYLPDWQKQVQAEAQKHQAFERATQGFNQAQQQAAQLLQNAIEFVHAKMPKQPDLGLAETDPFEYQKQKAHYDAEAGRLGQMVAQRNHMVQQAQQRNQQVFAQRLHQEREATLQALPDLRDPVKATKFAEQVKSLGSELGYTPAELNQIRDHRLMKLIAKAIKADQYEQALATARAKQKAPEPPPVQAPQRRRTPSQVETENLRTRMAKLAKNPSSTKAAEDVLSTFD